MKARLALAVAALQVLVLAFMAGQREWILRAGAPLVLRTAPVDPNDPMRGAYVRLHYEVSFVPAALCQDEVQKWIKSGDYYANRGVRDRVVYVAVKVNPYGIAELVSLGETPPASGPFLRGRVESVSPAGVQVRYGIEAHFMSKAAAQRTEKQGFERAGAPMNVTVAVGSSGTAVLKDTAWEPLGLTFAIDRPPERPREPGQTWQQPRLTGMTVTLHNYGDKDIAIVNLPNGRSFNLVPNHRFQHVHYRWSGRDTIRVAGPTGADIVVLKPGAKHEVHLDLTQPEWWITDTDKAGSPPIPLQQIPQQDAWSASFRLEYAPPTADAVRGLPNADLIRHAPLRSRAFNANQGVD